MTRIDPQIRSAARRLRAEATEEERMLWCELRELNRLIGTHFRRQAPVGRFVLDFADLGRKLVIELDGSQHNLPDGLKRDGDRDAWLKKQGFVVLRFWNRDVRGNFDGMMQTVLDAVEASARTGDTT